MNVPDRCRGRLTLSPRLEPLEARELLSFTLLHQARLAVPGTLAALVTRAAAEARAAAAVPNPSPPPADTTGTPTPHEVRRQSYVGRFKGDYVIGPGRTSDQSIQLTSKGYGGANQAFHLWTDLRITVPTDPARSPTGVIYVIPWNVGTTGTQLFLDLTGDPATKVNGIPTHYTWTVDPSSSGIYGSAGGYGTGHGTLDIQFFRPGPGKIPGTLRGQMNFSVNGLIDTSGNFNVIGVLGNIPRRP